MKILFYDMGSYTYNDFIYYLKLSGHTCKTVYYHFADKFNDIFFCERFQEYLSADCYDVVISVNFFPLMAKLCNERHIKYLSWCYDSPLAEQLEDYFAYDTNYIFLFDRVEAEQYRAAGYQHVYHLPLAVNTRRLASLCFSPKQIAAFQADISFVGQLYDSPLSTLLYSSSNYVRGYIEGLLQAQLRIYGYHFIDDLITEDLLRQINDSFLEIGQSKITLNRRGLAFAIDSEITHLERSFLLEQMGELFDTHFYTAGSCQINGNVKKHGPVKYFEEMPCVFRHSKLNLNPTLKSIQSGIPLRALDIMGAGGALLSNYQPELLEYFQEEKDIILYHSMEDAIDKAAFYLKHDSLRQEIAQSGCQKIQEHFTYPARIQNMFETAELL